MSHETNAMNANDLPAPEEDKSKFRKNAKVGLICLSLAGAMVGVSYAAVPLYRIFCQITGYGGTTQKAEEYKGKVSEKVFTVSFDSNISRELAWKFKPKQREVKLRLGEKVTAYYMATNIGKDTSTGESTFNVSPQAAGQYFNKIQCFCFTEQTLAAGEKVEMPVLFYIDPEIVNDPLFENISTITLSYTFYPKELDETAKSAGLKKPANPTSKSGQSG